MTGDDLLAQIRDRPDDEAPRLVYADWLTAQGDPRGELILLDECERRTPGGLADRAMLERLLVLAAEHGFPRLPDDPDAAMLPFRGGGREPVEYRLIHQDHLCVLRYHWSELTIELDGVELVREEIAVEGLGAWTDEETHVILSEVSAAIRAGAPLDELALPADLDAMHAHPCHRRGPWPAYGFPPELGAPAAWRLAARDRDRWYALWKRRGALAR